MVAMLTMIWGLGACAEVSNRLTSPRVIAVSPNQLERDMTVDDDIYEIFLPDECEEPRLHHGAEDVAPPAVIWVGELGAEQQDLVDHQVEAEVEQQEIQKEAPGWNGIKKVKQEFIQHAGCFFG